MTQPLDLMTAIDRALCANPKTGLAWANIKAAAAAVGVSKSAYLPTLSASSQYMRQHVRTSVEEQAGLDSSYTEGVNSEALSLSWVLYDFGARSADVDNSRALLDAARFSDDVALQSEFATVAQDYYAAQSAAANVDATRDMEQAAARSLDAASVRVARGVAPISDQLQADTAHAQAAYQKSKADDDYRTAVGTLAIDMNLPPDTVLELPKLDSDRMPLKETGTVIHDLIAEALSSHPSVKVAEAQWQAALAKIRSIRAQGLPTLSAVGQFSYSDQPISASLGQPELPAATRDGYVGVKLSIPLFEGFGRSYQLRQAQAQAEAQDDTLRDVKQQVAVAVWSSYQSLQAATDNMHSSQTVLHCAHDAFEASQHRYESGVGSVVELLSVQSALSAAQQQDTQAQADWQTARIRLAESLGTLKPLAAE